MKNSLMLICASIFCIPVLAQSSIPVTFKVDMGVQTFIGTFNPASDLLVIRGNFQMHAGDPGGNWQGNYFQMEDSNGDTIYTLTINIPNIYAGTNYEFKFVIVPDGWETIANKTFNLTSPFVNLPVYWFNNDSIYSAQQVVNTINFVADLSGIIGVGVNGAFDPAQDSLLVMGLDWDDLGILLSSPGSRRLQQDPLTPGIFSTSIIVRSGTGLGEGDSTMWKFKAFPQSRFSNSGWEIGDNRWLTYEPDGSIVVTPIINPRIWPLFDPISNDVEITFNVDMANAINRYNGELINPATLEFVGQRGGADWLGNWSTGGCWCPADTISGNMKVLTNTGNNIWTRSVTVAAGTQGGIFEYKYAAMYPGADTINGGSSPLDNEGSFGNLHSLVLSLPGPYVINDVFGLFQGSYIPVELISFTATNNDNIVSLSWSTASETNNHGFEIQRKTDDSEWRVIAFRAGKGTTTEIQNYSIIDDVSGISTNTFYYRLKQIDYDGSYAFSEIVNVEILSLRKSFALSQNYPNPFNPSTKISWQSPVDSWQVLKVFDVLGNEIRTLVNEYKQAGTHEVEFDASGLSSGVYYYQLRIGEYLQTKKMILIR